MSWLATFPSTNALVATAIVMALASTAGVLAGWHPPEGWFGFIEVFGGISAAQFSAKRLTHGVLGPLAPKAKPPA